MSLSLVDDVQLIEEVKKHPLLFDTNAKGYKNHAIKDKTWNKIGSKLQVKPLEAKNRWRNLRDRFVREKKLMSLENEVEKNQKTSPWPLLDHMSFIWNFIIHRRRYTVNTIKSEPKTYQAIASKRDGEEWTMALDCNSESQGVDDKIELDSPRQKRQKLLPYQEQSIEEAPDLHQVSDDTRSYSQRTEHCINSQSYIADEQHYFCMSVAETLRRFTQRQSAEAKLKIQQILYEIEFGDTNTTFEDAFIDPQ